MNKKYILLGVLVLLIGSFFIIRAEMNNGQDNSLESETTMTTTPAMPAKNDTTPSAQNVAHNIRVEIQTLAQYVASHPEDTTHVLRLARLYQDSHEPKKAAPLYERYVRANKKSGIQPWLDLTNCYGETNEWTEALDVTKRMLKRFPGNPSTLYNQGAIYANMGKFKEAKQSWNKVLKSDAPAKIIHLARQSLKKLKSPSN